MTDLKNVSGYSYCSPDRVSDLCDRLHPEHLVWDSSDPQSARTAFFSNAPRDYDPRLEIAGLGSLLGDTGAAVEYSG